MRRRINGILTLLLLVFSYSAKAKDSTSYYQLQSIENNIKGLAYNIINYPIESQRVNATNDFIDSFRYALEIEESFEYPFDSLTTIKSITSPDKKIRVYSFNLILNNQDHYYYAFIQRKTKKGMITYELSDTVQTLPYEHIYAELYSHEWIGAVYYDIQKVKRDGKTLYTVLGYDGATKSTTKKVADVIWFNDEEELVLGYPLFRMFKGDVEPQYRFEVEFANDAVIVMRFEVTAKKSQKLIVFSYVGPKSFELKGVKSAYYPDGTYDFFIFEKKRWTMYKQLQYFDFKDKE